MWGFPYMWKHISPQEYISPHEYMYIYIYYYILKSIHIIKWELASEWLPVRTLPCTVSLALRRRPCGLAILSGYLINSWVIPNFICTCMYMYVQLLTRIEPDMFLYAQTLTCMYIYVLVCTYYTYQTATIHITLPVHTNTHPSHYIPICANTYPSQYIRKCATSNTLAYQYIPKGDQNIMWTHNF